MISPNPKYGPARIAIQRRPAAVLSPQFFDGKERGEDGLLAVET